MKNFGIFFILFALLFSACRDNIDDVTVDITTPTPPFLEDYNPAYLKANGDLTGFVMDEAGQPVQSASVKVADWTTTTDQFGHFFFTNIDMNAAGTVVRVEKEGYFLGSRRFNAVESVENRVEIKLLPKNFNQTFETEAGGTITMNGGATVVFAPNSIRTADGTAYNGAVKVAATWLDPSKVATLDEMPGNLFGVNNRGEEVVLGTYGMIAVELESASGEPLNILAGKTATITMPVPSVLLNGAPAEIPLWSYNEEFGVWAEEGAATLSNGTYTAEVSHFSYWNCDFPSPLVNFTAIITDESGNPLENYQVVILLPGTVFSGSGYTCEGGTVAGLIPANEILELEILGVCGEALYTQAIGPFGEDTDLGTIAIPTSQLGATTLTGQLVDCDGNAVENGVVIANFTNGTVYEYLSDGSFSFTFSSCASVTDVEVTGYDLNALTQSDVVLATTNQSNDLGSIEICDVQLQNFISVNIDGVEQVYLNCVGLDSLGSTEIVYQDFFNNDGFIKLVVGGNTAGDYSDNHILFQFFDFNNNWIFSNEMLETVVVTEYGAVGEQIVGSFSGTVTNNPNQNPTEITISGAFSVERLY